MTRIIQSGLGHITQAVKNAQSQMETGETEVYLRFNGLDMLVHRDSRPEDIGLIYSLLSAIRTAVHHCSITNLRPLTEAFEVK